ncbi:MAG: LysR family transcriptional regulator [Synergistales bacterium]|nr:LysR family transcriptional regulator [Synergistales bacterium]
MQTRALESLVAIVEQGGISRAAAHLGISQPAVSKQVARLEEELGVELLERGRARSVLTTQGRIVYDHALVVLGRLETMQRSVQESLQQVAGSVTVAASSIPGDFLLPDLLVGFREAYPAVDVAVHVSDTRQALEELMARRVDVAIVGAERQLPGLHFHPFFRDELVLALSPEHPLGEREQVTLNELADLELIGRVEGSGTLTVLREAVKQAGLGTPRFRLSFGHSAGVVRAVKAGGGAGIISRRALEGVAGIAVCRFAPPLERSFYLAHGNLSRRTAAVLVDYLSARAGLR